jgi:hypothetical protein
VQRHDLGRRHPLESLRRQAGLPRVETGGNETDESNGTAPSQICRSRDKPWADAFRRT